MRRSTGRGWHGGRPVGPTAADGRGRASQGRHGRRCAAAPPSTVGGRRRSHDLKGVRPMQHGDHNAEVLHLRSWLRLRLLLRLQPKARGALRNCGPGARGVGRGCSQPRRGFPLAPRRHGAAAPRRQTRPRLAHRHVRAAGPSCRRRRELQGRPLGRFQQHPGRLRFLARCGVAPIALRGERRRCRFAACGRAWREGPTGSPPAVYPRGHRQVLSRKRAPEVVAPSDSRGESSGLR
mmetsp:Transcript_9216/g.24197  ORF Transcript_9216/g.24197 Transcript_9216/m.24197 type:complete len:236 (-) Transcript_9216:1282-1989(-)